MHVAVRLAIAGFTGRAAQLRCLDEAVAGDRSAMPVLVIDGAPGVGKTALAVYWAWRVRDRFPDGQLYVDLRTYSGGAALRPIDALARFLPALGVTAERIPSDVDDAATLFRSVVAGRRLLIVLDNARDAGQVRQLLPGDPGCVVVVTSRERLDGLVARDGAARLGLGVLTAEEGRTLLSGLLGAERGPAPAVAKLTQLCGYLPLALRIAAANLLAHPLWTIEDYLIDLNGADRLAALEITGDVDAAIRPAFGHSYTKLPADSRRMFRFAGLAPGADVTAPVAAALAGIEHQAAARLLDRLAAAHLMEEHKPRRYAHHDLLRCYAARCAEAEDTDEDRRAALERLFDHYLAMMDAAVRLLYPETLRLPAEPSTIAFTDHADALAWLDAERANIVAAVDHAAVRGPRPYAWRLADLLRGYLYSGLHTADWPTVAKAAFGAAQAEGDRWAQAAAHLSFAALHGVQNRHAEAIEHYSQAETLSRAVGWSHGESAALGNLATIYRRRGQLMEAARCLRAAADLDRRTGWLAGLATKLANLGLVITHLGYLDEALQHSRDALALHEQTGARVGIARTLVNIGEIEQYQGDLGAAEITLSRAVDKLRAVGDRGAECYALRALAQVYRDLGRWGPALDLAQDALRIAREVDDPRVEADALCLLAAVEQPIGGVLTAYNRNLELTRTIGDRHAEADTLLRLAGVHQVLGDAERAEEYAAAGLAICREGGYRLLERQWEGRAPIPLAASAAPTRPDQGYDP